MDEMNIRQTPLDNQDIKLLNEVFYNIDVTMDNATSLCLDYLLYIAEPNDIQKVYKDYKESESDNSLLLPYDKFVQEFNKGYGNSGNVEISRYINLSNGVWYDTEYC